MRRERTNFAPALLVAIALHGAVLFGGLIAWPWLSQPTPVGAVTAVTLVAAPPEPLRPAVEAPEPAPAAAPEPTPAPPTPPPPAAAPKPTPPTPQPEPKPVPAAKPTPPQPTPKPTPAPPKPTPAKPQPAKPAQTSGLDLAALTSSLDKVAKTDSRRSAPAKGPPQAETAPAARDMQGEAEAATNDAAAVVGERLNKLWNKSCGVEGFRDIVIQVRFNLNPDGSLAQGSAVVLNKPLAPSPVWDAASARAVIAIGQAAPFRELPKKTYAEWRTFTAVFDGKEACKNP